MEGIKVGLYDESHDEGVRYNIKDGSNDVFDVDRFRYGAVEGFGYTDKIGCLMGNISITIPSVDFFCFISCLFTEKFPLPYKFDKTLIRFKTTPAKKINEGDDLKYILMYLAN